MTPIRHALVAAAFVLLSTAVAAPVEPLAWRTDRVNGSSPFYEIVDTFSAGHTLTLRRIVSWPRKEASRV